MCDSYPICDKYNIIHRHINFENRNNSFYNTIYRQHWKISKKLENSSTDDQNEN